MRSRYKKIGSFVKQVNVRNRDLSVTNLQGININKFFMPSVANTNGTDLSKYKVVSQKQFAFNPMHVGRDEVLPISMLEEQESVIVSPAYIVFKVKDESQLLPEYLMMWCRRPEFDRNAWFTTDSSVRGGFSWKDFCDLTFPVPSIEKQREIVREYHAIVDRIKLNEQLNQKLEETAQAIYKKWFVDFEFPITKEHAAKMGKPELEGKPYKSSGGKLVWNDELEQEIPEGWEYLPYTELIDLKGGGTPSTTESSYWNGEIPFFTPKDVGSSIYSIDTEKNITNEGLKQSSTKIYDKNTVFITARGTVGIVSMASKKMAMNQSCYAAIGKKNIGQHFVYQHTVETLKKLKNEANGGVFGALVTRDFEGQSIINPDLNTISNHEETVTPIYEFILNRQIENYLLLKTTNLFLSKITKEETTA